ncbi:MAG: hypothetical protein JXN62_10870 [Bacteroidales bacterium]|nr:hypothetical protein [Bacteroidales bacterium]
MLKKIARFFLPEKIRIFFFRMIPRVSVVNTYIMSNPLMIEKMNMISGKYSIREINPSDIGILKQAYETRSKISFENKIPARLNSDAWTGLAVFDKTNGNPAYLAWVITKSIPYFEEFGVKLKEGQFLLKDGYCFPDYRHQGLHSRMEQERINYCVRHGASEIFIQIHDSNKKGIKSVTSNGYRLHKDNFVIHWPLFNVYRELLSFLKNPFKNIIK